MYQKSTKGIIVTNWEVFRKNKFQMSWALQFYPSNYSTPIFKYVMEIKNDKIFISIIFIWAKLQILIKHRFEILFGSTIINNL